MEKPAFEKVLRTNGWNAVDLRDTRYNQVIHLITAADGAEDYYNTEDNPCRTEGIELARELDKKTAESWVGHPYIDVIDNSTDFESKMIRMINVSFLKHFLDHSIHYFLVVCLPPNGIGCTRSFGRGKQETQVPYL